MSSKLDYLYYRHVAPEGMLAEDVASLSKHEKIADLLEHYATAIGVIHGSGEAVDELLDSAISAVRDEIKEDPDEVMEAISSNEIVSATMERHLDLVEQFKEFETALIEALVEG